MTSLEAYVDDICKRQDFINISITNFQSIASTGGHLVPGQYYYYVAGYDVYDRPIAISEKQSIVPSANSTRIAWSTSNLGSVSYYRIYRLFGTTSTFVTLLAPADVYIDLGPGGGDVTGIIPTEATRYYRLTGSSPELVEAWTAYTGDIEITLSDVTALDTSGYIQIDKEVIYYGGKSGSKLTGVLRGQGDTDSTAVHDVKTSVYELLQFAPGNPFTHLKTILTKADISSYKHASFDTYETAWAGINMSLKAVVKSTKLSEIFFDLVNILDCHCWENEDGLIEIRYKSEVPETIAELSDEYSFIKDSPSVDLNESSRYTRCELYWNRVDLSQGLSDEEAYNRTTVYVDSDAESTNEYNEETPDTQYTAWINAGDNSDTDTQNYILQLLTNRISRIRDAQTLFEADLEQKDGDIRICDIVSISTHHLQDKDGKNFDSVYFRVVKKKSKTISFKLKVGN
jgi:hypothetical protein